MKFSYEQSKDLFVKKPIKPFDAAVRLLIHFLQEEKKESAAFIYAGMEACWLRPVVGQQYPLDKASQAHHDIIESPGAAGKMVLLP